MSWEKKPWCWVAMLANFVSLATGPITTSFEVVSLLRTQADDMLLQDTIGFLMNAFSIGRHSTCRIKWWGDLPQQCCLAEWALWGKTLLQWRLVWLLEVVEAMVQPPVAYGELQIMAQTLVGDKTLFSGLLITSHLRHCVNLPPPSPSWEVIVQLKSRFVLGFSAQNCCPKSPVGLVLVNIMLSDSLGPCLVYEPVILFTTSPLLLPTWYQAKGHRAAN